MVLDDTALDQGITTFELKGEAISKPVLESKLTSVFQPDL